MIPSATETLTGNSLTHQTHLLKKVKRDAGFSTKILKKGLDFFFFLVGLSQSSLVITDLRQSIMGQCNISNPSLF